MLGWVVLALTLVAAALLVATELSTLSYRTAGLTCSEVAPPAECTTKGGAAHHHALWLIAVAVLVFGVGAAVGRSRPSAYALIACGVAVLVIALAIDMPDLGDKRHLDTLYSGVRAHTGSAFADEVLAGLAAVAAGLLALVRRPRVAGPRPQEERLSAGERAEIRRRRREGGGA